MHVRDGPLRNFQGQRKSFRISIGEKYESVDRLRTALDIERECFVVIVLWDPFFEEEGLLPVFVSTCQVFVEAMIAGAFFIVLEAIENIGCMKIVDPVQVCSLSVIP